MTIPEQEIVVRHREQQVDNVERALERGGLPTEEEVEAISLMLSDFHDKLEALAWRVEGIADSDYGEDLPSVIDLSELGVIAVLLADLDNRVDETRDLKRRIEQRMFSLTAIRTEQLARIERGMAEKANHDG